MPCITDKPAIHSIENELNQTKEKLSETEREMRQVEIDHAFNWWWYNTGSRPPKSSHDLEEHTEVISREAYNEAVKQFGTDTDLAPCQQSTEERAGLLYSLFALGVVVGICIAIATFLLVINPN
jgi:hypothetical protein